MHELVRVTTKDYRNYRRCYERIEYSFCKKGEETPNLSKMISEMTKPFLPGKGEFLNHVENPCRELYFYKIDGEIEGYVELIFKKEVCKIYQFSVYQHGKGWGSSLFDEIMKIIKTHRCKKIHLWCPYEGAQQFWLKKGFSRMSFKSDFFKKNVK